MHPHLLIHFQPAEKATKRMFAEILQIQREQSPLFFISAKGIYPFLPFCAALLFLTKFLLWIKADHRVSVTQTSLQWHDIFNGFCVTTTRMSELIGLSRKFIVF